MSDEKATLDHEWEAPPDNWIQYTSWSPGACAHREVPAGYPCGVHFLAMRHQGQQ